MLTWSGAPALCQNGTPLSITGPLCCITSNACCAPDADQLARLQTCVASLPTAQAIYLQVRFMPAQP